MIRSEAHYIPWETETGARPGERLHMKRWWPESDPLTGTPVLLLHGMVENGRIFYSESGKGLAPFLARHGFDVFCADLRGRGESAPPIDRESDHGQFESITRELPAFVERIRDLRGRGTPQIWGAHSWGGCLLLAALARMPEYRQLVRGVVFFGAKRTVFARNWETRFKVGLFWQRAARLVVAVCGYLPGRALRVGSDNETALSHRECSRWVPPTSPWVDPRDGFDYGAALPACELPPLMFFAGVHDRALGHPQDMRALIRELGPQEVEFRVLGRATGNRHDYGHVDMLTHPDAAEDHFPEVLRWIRAALRDDVREKAAGPDGPGPAERGSGPGTGADL